MSTQPDRGWQPVSSVLAELAFQPAHTAQPTPTAAARCPECNGAGFFGLAVPFGHPRFGELIPCSCTLRRRAERQMAHLAALSNLAAFADETFATFDPDVPGVRRAYVRAAAFAQRPQGWLLLFGPCGVGKTHLAAATAHTALARGEPAVLTVVPDLLDHLRAAFAPDSPVAYDALAEQVRNAPLLILDDLGTEQATPWAREKLYQIISHRATAQLPTVITSNRAPEALEPRLRSRMAQHAFMGEVLQIDAADYRWRGVRRV